MNCFMFPGQPLSRGAALPEDADFRQVASLVREVARLDLDTFRWLEGGGSEHLKLQLLGVAQGIHQLRLLRRQGVRPDLVAEHSMGIYPALVACGSLTEAEAVEVAWRIGSTFASLAKSGSYALGCVVGLQLKELLPVADRHRVYLANHNTSRHFLLAGKEEQITAALAEAAKGGAFSTAVFPYDGPLHTPLMEKLEPEVRKIARSYRYREPVSLLMNHLDQRSLTAGQIPEFLFRELCLPVYWERTYRALRAAGATRFFEMGGGSLKKYNRWIEGEM